jgi:integrase
MRLSDIEDLVFPAAHGGPVAYEWFMKAVWREAIKEATFEASPHDLRHFFGSLLLAFNEPETYICQQMGHSSPTATRNVYLHLIREGRRLDREATLVKLSAACGEGAVKIMSAVQKTGEAQV